MIAGLQAWLVTDARTSCRWFVTARGNSCTWAISCSVARTARIEEAGVDHFYRHSRVIDMGRLGRGSFSRRIDDERPATLMLQ
ncbi:hypothetical protein PC129_g18227 [Phytophthora cactorum]|uniref:Uncharacterized protein n=1 Tax=Phytophthora cactorum TaxID=29920 RepID=A0A8T1BI28_9STRA|nr:hypothetical protein Pcac1_g26502 [Phytophthora cactorum]KAG2802624.1 hypothetical protein PC112_g19549 [Phytophthora cactorum]KAG2803490.1 hypothetical protein PC111_g18659 [Phytophthora cactorum]KAG2881960.1 hypothetical protein PC114_g21287 [Phytophthora cactorum]KAG2892236.1 hypothetical protein PC115_g18915 [Phytophthora cactorum]